jgi:hypothetical protein
VTPALAGVAFAVVLGGVIAVSARTPRTAVLGLVIVLVGSGFVAQPLPDSLGLAARIVGAVLAGELLWVAVRGVDLRTEGSRLGWPAELLIAGAGAAVGYGSYGLGAPAAGPLEAQVAGFAIGALAIAPLTNGRDTLRIGAGVVLLLAGALLLAVALGGTPAPDRSLVIAGFVAVVGGAVAAMAAGARANGGAFDLSPGGPARTGRQPDAHTLEVR